MKDKVIDLYTKGMNKRQIADYLNIGYSTVRLYLKGVTFKHVNELPNTRFICRTCGLTGTENFYSSANYQCKKCWNQRTYQSTKIKIANYMESRGGAKCQKCGYDKCMGALDFHHRDPSQKDPLWNRGWNIAKLKEELDKCDILCANCHREIHFAQK